MAKPLARKIVIHSPWPGWNCVPPWAVTSLRASRCGRSSSRRAGPGGSGQHTAARTLMVWNASRPPGRSSRAASGTHRAGSHHKLAPHSDTARSKLPDGSGTSPASASMSGKKRRTDPGSAVRWRAGPG
jgi:hypothetical protein